MRRAVLVIALSLLAGCPKQQTAAQTCAHDNECSTDQRCLVSKCLMSACGDRPCRSGEACVDDT